MRISRYLARCGIASRRKAEEIVLAGRVTVNRETVTALHTVIDEERDDVRLDGVPLQRQQNILTLAMNKREKVVVTRDDPQQRTTVYDELPEEFQDRASELIYAGRLDYATSGLLILSTDGDLINRLTHPRQAIPKVYAVRLNRELSDTAINALRTGVDLDGVMTLPAKVQVGSRQNYYITITEGKNRQIRRMIEAIGARVISLQRIAIGGLTLTDLSLEQGDCRALSEEEVRRIFSEGSAT